VATPSSVSAGGCATVAWAVDNVTAVYFQGQGVTGHESRQVCPIVSTTYTLNVILLDGTSSQRQVTVAVK